MRAADHEDLYQTSRYPGRKIEAVNNENEEDGEYEYESIIMLPILVFVLVLVLVLDLGIFICVETKRIMRRLR
jgi:hypothetical protein